MGTDDADATADRAKAVLKVKFLRHLVKGVCARVTYIASNDTLKKSNHTEVFSAISTDQQNIGDNVGTSFLLYLKDGLNSLPSLNALALSRP